jgi:hypothetical protein
VVGDGVIIRTEQTQRSVENLISIAKIEEFAKLADGTLPPVFAGLEFIKRIPVGFYQLKSFNEAEGDSNDDDVDKCVDIFVYDCTREHYKKFWDLLEKKVPQAITNVDEMANDVNTKLFGATNLLYSQKDITEIIKYYQKTGHRPEMIEFAERDKYDISSIARTILHKDLKISEQTDFINHEWEHGKQRWSAFFGYNKEAFNAAIFYERIRLEKSKVMAPAGKEPTTSGEIIDIHGLPLHEIKLRDPDIGQKLEAAVYSKFTDKDGYYSCAKSGCGYRSKSKRNFQIDHKKPMVDGGKTVPENLQLLCRQCNIKKTRAENVRKSDR